jgi:hypothetical protein
VIEYEPMVRFEVLKVATPEPLSVALPSAVAPSKNVTEPQETAEDEVTLAVNVTDWPKTVEPIAEVSATDVASGWTVMVAGADWAAE